MMEESNTQPIDATVASWLLSDDLEMDDLNIFPKERNLNFLEADLEEFISHDIANALRETSGCNNYSSSSNIIPTAESLSRNISLSSFNSQIILSFDNPNLSSSPANTNAVNNQFYGLDEGTLNPSNAETAKGSSKATLSRRSPAHAHDNIMAERKRREKLSQSFIALGSLLPGLKKMDKASVLRDAINYVKELKERLAELEKQSKKTNTSELVVVFEKPEICGIIDESNDAAVIGANESLFEVEARVSEQQILLRIRCQKRKGLVVKLLAEIENFNLFIVKISVLPFGESILHITLVAQMGEGYNLTIKEFIKKLRLATLKFVS